MVAESILAFEGDGPEGGGQRFGLHILVLLILVLRFFLQCWHCLASSVCSACWMRSWSILLVNFLPSSRRKVSRLLIICPFSDHHFGDGTAVEYHSAHELYVVVAEFEDSSSCFSTDGEGFGEEVVEGFALS